MRHLVIGSKGEVGAALMEVLAEKHIVEGVDIGPEFKPSGLYEVMHVALPWSDKFIDIVHRYAQTYLAPGGLIINHSTVPLGTTEKLRPDAVHSPIRGVHPHLKDGIKTFVKFFGGTRAPNAAQFFYQVGIECFSSASARDTEAAKLWCTTAYGLQILIEKAIHKYCVDNGLDFKTVYYDWVITYNVGYQRLGMPYVARPRLDHVPGPIGGHCVIPNAKIIEHWLGDLLIQTNDTLHKEETGS